MPLTCLKAVRCGGGGRSLGFQPLATDLTAVRPPSRPPGGPPSRPPGGPAGRLPASMREASMGGSALGSRKINAMFYLDVGMRSRMLFATDPISSALGACRVRGGKGSANGGTTGPGRGGRRCRLGARRGAGRDDAGRQTDRTDAWTGGRRGGPRARWLVLLPLAQGPRRSAPARRLSAKGRSPPSGPRHHRTPPTACRPTPWAGPAGTHAGWHAARGPRHAEHAPAACSRPKKARRPLQVLDGRGQ